MPTTIRLGTCSPATQSTRLATLALLDRLARRAASKRIDLLLLPEAFLGGYPRGTNFGCAIGHRSAEGRDEFVRHFRAAVDLGDTVGDGAGAGERWLRRKLGPDDMAYADVMADGLGTSGEIGRRGDGTREELERIAKTTGVFLVVGCIERAGGSLYCAVVYVCPSRGIIGKRRKVQPTGTERLCWAAGSPATLRAVSAVIRGVRINMAAAICWENYMPLLRQALYAQNVNLYLAPTADGRDAWLSLIRTIGCEGRCFVVSANMCVRDKEQDTGVNRSTEKSPERQRQRRRSCITEDGFEVALPEPRSVGFGGRDGETSPGRQRRRRHSCMTEDGFEVALPTPTTTTEATKSPTRTQRPRRRSVLDEDGNEIVLCCKDVVGSESAPPVIAEEDGEPETSPGLDKQRKRRMSVFDEDGHEIVLCCEANGTKGKETNGKAIEVGEKLRPSAPAMTGLTSRGGSAIVSPFGDVLAGPQWDDDEDIICADVDFEDCIRGRLDLDVGGSYSRNDAFKFSVEGLDLSPLPY